MAKSKFWNADKIIAVSAMVISIGTFIIYLYQTHLIQKQQYAAVWPNLEIGPIIEFNDKTNSYIIKIENSGVGPAIIEEVYIQYKGKKYNGSFWQFIEKHFAKDTLDYHSSDLYIGRVFQAGKVVELLKSNDTKTAQKLFELFSGERGKPAPVSIYIRYRSIYDEKWVIEDGFSIPKKL